MQFDALIVPLNSQIPFRSNNPLGDDMRRLLQLITQVPERMLQVVGYLLICIACQSFVVAANVEAEAIESDESVESIDNAEPSEARPLPVAKDNWLDRIFAPRLTELKNRADKLTEELAQSPPYSPQDEFRGGFHTQYRNDPYVTEWVQIDLGDSLPFDRIVLAPVYIKRNQQFVSGYGFPVRFYISVSDDIDFRESKVIADYTNADVELPGNYPFQISFTGVKGRYIRMTTTKLASQDGHHFAAIGELLVLSGNRNIAQWRPVRASSSIEANLRWSTTYLVDEFSLMPSPLGAETSPSDGFKFTGGTFVKPHHVIVDLKQSVPVDEVRLYPAQPSDAPSVPGWGFPAGFSVELSEDIEFTNPFLIAIFQNDLRHWTDRPHVMPVGARDYLTSKASLSMQEPSSEMFSIKPVNARYVRVSITATDSRLSPPTWSLSEIQVYSQDKVVSLHADVMVKGENEFEEDSGRWQRSALVDGFTSRRRLEELPVWLNHLQSRWLYETELSETIAAIETSQRTLRRRLGIYGGSILALALSGLFLGFVYQRRRIRLETRRLRDRIASDLHDDIGSNLGTISLLSRTLVDHGNTEKDLQEDLLEISQIAADTSDAMRDILWIIRPKSLTLDEFVGQLRQVSKRMLGHCQLTFEAPTVIRNKTVDIAWRRNLFLSYKEILHNIQRHSQAQQVAITITIESKWVRIIIRDDGVKFNPSKAEDGHGLSNIRKRIAELRGTITYESKGMHCMQIDVPLGK